MKRTLLNNLIQNEETKISGFIERIRDNTNADLIKKLENVIAGSVIEFTGKMVLSEYVKQGGREFLPTDLKILSVADPSPLEETANIDTRLDYRWIDLRTDKNQLMLNVQSTLVQGMRDFLYKEDFTEIHTPKLISTASESGSSVFEVQYFDRKAYLAQTEFTSFDLEFAYIDSYEDVMNMEEDLIIAGLTLVKEKYGDLIKEVFDKEVIIPTKPFPRIKLQDLYKELENKYGYKIPEFDVGDMNAEAEGLAYKYAMEKYGHEFIFITDFAKTKRAFYHMRKDDVPQGYDLIWRGTEITTGAQREHRYDILKAQCDEKGLGKDVAFYLQFFKYGCPPHGGFAIGVDRLTMLLLGIPSLKEEMFIFRGPNRLEP